MGRNPATGEAIKIKASRRVRITPLKAFKDAVLSGKAAAKKAPAKKAPAKAPARGPRPARLPRDDHASRRVQAGSSRRPRRRRRPARRPPRRQQGVADPSRAIVGVRYTIGSPRLSPTRTVGQDLGSETAALRIRRSRHDRRGLSTSSPSTATTPRVPAGGQSLIPLMALRLARPTRLVDVGRIAELQHLLPNAGSSSTGSSGAGSSSGGLGLRRRRCASAGAGARVAQARHARPGPAPSSVTCRSAPAGRSAAAWPTPIPRALPSRSSRASRWSCGAVARRTRSCRQPISSSASSRPPSAPTSCSSSSGSPVGEPHGSGVRGGRASSRRLRPRRCGRRDRARR